MTPSSPFPSLSQEIEGLANAKEKKKTNLTTYSIRS